MIPKIPDETEIGENYTEKRICLAPSILECLKSAEIVNKFDDEVGLVRVYKVKLMKMIQIWSVGINSINTTFNRHNWLFIPILMC